jgi:hypothetical protein
MMYGLTASIGVQSDDHIELADDVVMALWSLVNQSLGNRALLAKVHFPAAESLIVRYR